MGAGKSSLVLRFVKGQFFDFQARGARGALCFLERASDTLLAPRGGAGVYYRRRVPHTNRVRQRHDREVRDLVRPCVAAVGAQPLVVACACARAAEARGVAAAAQGHRRPGALPQPRADVLPRHAEPPAMEVHCSSVPDARLLYVAQAPLPPSSCTTSQTAIPSRAPRAGCGPCRVSACALAFRALTCSRPPGARAAAPG